MAPAPAAAALGHSDIARLESALADAGLTRRPVAVVDLSALRANVEDLAQRANGKPLRLASKSLRVRSIIQRVLEHPGFRGVLCFTLQEALWLCSQGLRDLVLGYPDLDPQSLRLLASHDEARAAVTLMVDSVEQLDAIDAAAPGHPSLRVALELDASYRPARGVRIGAARSPQHTPRQLAALASAVLRRPGYALVGLMAYEAQIAGVADAGSSPRQRVVRAMQASSRRELAARRAEAVAAVRLVADLEFVNGGGTGSIESTAGEDAVTEVAAGSGLFGPALFDGYTGFRPRPALLFGLQAVRRPAPDTVTVLGGGWIASGAPARDRLPMPTWPPGLRYRATEGAGEVQTPLVGDAASSIALGQTVWFRHAKAGELCERIDEVVLVDGERVADVVPTYRGEGKAFL